VVVFLCSDLASDITGSEAVVDCGVYVYQEKATVGVKPVPE
jgi:enoyl-[acyl-carrier-protein] reductase (NADH)